MSARIVPRGPLSLAQRSCLQGFVASDGSSPGILMRGTDLNLGVWCGQQRQARYVLGAALQNLLWNARFVRGELRRWPEMWRGFEGCSPGSLREAPAPQTRGGRELSGAGGGRGPRELQTVYLMLGLRSWQQLAWLSAPISLVQAPDFAVTQEHL
uniref:Uncharacterized protein n=1 Tax=Rangifer tarandus platyrhynchus TaxID=3082113 RepID=A0ACB0DPK0_RANTA|nr:unnamed protein product [Rangifer tarandus platyrhynchus]